MRFVIVGPGAVGGVIGGRLAQHGHDVALVARGEHAVVMQRDGLLLESPTGEVRVHPRVVTDVGELGLGTGDVVIMAVKSQDTPTVLATLRDAMPVDVPIVCAQNGIANEQAALRLFRNVIGMNVMLPATHLVPGVVQISTTPLSGLLDVGRYPTGTDDVVREVAAALSASEFMSNPRDDIMRWKRTKLLMNLANALDALCGPGADVVDIARRARAEGQAVFTAAGWGWASDEEERALRADHLTMKPIRGQRRGGGSTWQSLARGGSVETDFLNGEIVLLGRLHGIPTPVNEVLQRETYERARAGTAPGSVDPAQLRSIVEAATS